MAKSPEEGTASLHHNLLEKTGKSHGYANQVALKALAPDDAPRPGSDDLANARYAGAKAALRPDPGGGRAARASGSLR